MGPPISIILVSPQGDANIGATARAMKNFGMQDLRLVHAVPHLTKPAFTWAVDARDLLESATRFPTLDAALTDRAFAVAFTRRVGRARKRHAILQEAAALIADRANEGGVALVFGREDQGLSNAEIGRCDMIVEIPTSQGLPSLNLAQSVLLACYEISQAQAKGMSARMPKHTTTRAEEQFVSKAAMTEILGVVEHMLKALGYENAPKTGLRRKIVGQFEKIFGRAGLTPRDIGMLEGLTTRVIQCCQGKPSLRSGKQMPE